MSKRDERAEFKQLEDDIVELRYFDQPQSNSFFSWKMPINEANDLAKWWDNEGVQVEKRQLPLIDYRFGIVLISMLTHIRVEAGGFDGYGRLKHYRYSLPRKVVEELGVWLQDRRGFFQEKKKCES